MTPPSLSRSRFLSGAQCHLRLCYDYHVRDLAPEPDATLQAVLDTGHEVGDLACKRYPGGHFVAPYYRHIPDALAETRKVLKEGAAPALAKCSKILASRLITWSNPLSGTGFVRKRTPVKSCCGCEIRRACAAFESFDGRAD